MEAHYKQIIEDHSLDRLVTNTSVEHPVKLIAKANNEENERSISDVLFTNLRKISRSDRIEYLEVLLITFRHDKRVDKIKRDMTPPSTQDVICSKREFEREHGRKPNEREKKEIYEKLQEETELHLKEYYRLKERAQDLHDKLCNYISKANNTIESIAERRSKAGNKYSKDDIEQILSAYFNNSELTYKQVIEQTGIEIPSTTFYDWRKELDWKMENVN